MFLVIIAGNHDQAATYAAEYGIARPDWTYPAGPERLYGRRGGTYTHVGTWYYLDWTEVIDYLKSHDFARVPA